MSELNETPQEQKEEKTITLDAGNMYELNKKLVHDAIDPMSSYNLKMECSKLITEFVNLTNNHYYMLLCNDRKDYTVFHISDMSNLKTLSFDLYECLFNRGKCYSIEMTEDKTGIEIWMRIEGEAFCYYFFPYDVGVIES